MGHTSAGAERCSSKGQTRMWAVRVFTSLMVALLFSGASASISMTVYLSSSKVTPPLSGTPLIQGSIHLSIPEPTDSSSLPIYFSNLNLDPSVAQPITAVRLFAGGPNTVSGNTIIDFGVNTSGTVFTTPAVVRSILADPANFYVSVYNSVYQDTGVVRGQLPNLLLNVALSAANELPPVGTIATGSAVLSFFEDAVCVSDVTIQSPTTHTLTGAHLHQGGSTQVGPVVVFLPMNNQLSDPACTWVSPGLMQDITGNLTNYYLNFHDLENINNGLMRNGLSTAVAAVGLESGAEVPAVSGGGTGRVLINVLGNNTVCFWQLAVTPATQKVTGLTIGSGSAGQNGPALVTFGPGGQPTFPSGGCMVVSNDVFNQVLNPGSNHYVNLLTADHTTGAARGQLVAQGQTSSNFVALNRAAVAPPTASSNSGSSMIIIIIIAVVCAVVIFALVAVIVFFLWRKKAKAKDVDHTALAHKWFDWNPQIEILPVTAGASPPLPAGGKHPPQSVVIHMPEGGQNVGQIQPSKDFAISSPSSDRSGSEKYSGGAERPQTAERVTSHERAQALTLSGGQSLASPSRSLSTISTNGSLPMGLATGDTGTCRSFTLREVLIATDYFNESGELGGGGFGKVYRGVLADGSLIAVKRMKKESKQGMREFINEVRLLGRLKHPNLVRLVGFCATDEEQLLCYEYMPNGNLAQHLRGAHKPLSWRMRLEVAIGAAKGLDHLHVIATPPVIHRDVKSSNILLDEDWNAKVADFGLSKAALTNASQPASSTFVRGTPGYFDPEYYEGQRLTEKSDVYAFGVVLLEMLTGRKPIDQTLPSSEGSLAKWARPQLVDHERTLSIVDPRIQGSMTRASVLKVGALAHQCISLQGEDRPSMSAVVLRLQDANSS